MQTEHLTGIKKQFEYYESLVDKTIDQLSEEELLWKYNEESNSIAVIVKHLYGNLLSRFTDFLTSDGEKTWRDRDEEFEDRVMSKQELLNKWNEAWQCVFDTIDSLTEDDLDKIIYIRNMGHTVMEALIRSVAHVASHAGQIVFIGKMIKKDQWHSLSIPKGNSKMYNAEKFSKEKHREHFTDEFREKKE
ncbi:DUF1572 family protein [Ferruginibacter albus]|uniref:DUF1572 family protein n=1 Tax=Ferruginibacter albus TaxID=2875540 RepID=UPI001CC43A41|nr:DUF1572 family protein [Ferruginibacter albus]UAY51029.1 DUF1572 domain-containing protein [Ferruginibacter albus]